MERFKPPELHEEPIVKCGNCETRRYFDDMHFDEMGERYFCGKTCFYEWADDNFEFVSDYYWRMNIEY